MAASQRFTKLKEKVETADSNVKAAAAQDEADLRAKVEEARKRADEQAAQLQANARKTSEQAEGNRNEVQSNWDQHIQRMRAHIDERKAEPATGNSLDTGSLAQMR